MQYSSFNPKARWDRRIPESDRPKETEAFDESIQVVALFKGGKIYPKEFIWNNKEYKIQRITYNWQERRGTALINYFSVACADNLYQISFDNTSFGWRINKVL